MKHAALILALVVAIVFAGGAQEAPDLRTRAELTAFEETSSYDDVLRLVNGIVESSPLATWERFGNTEEGRALPLLMLSDPAVVTPEAARELGRPIVFIMANIHGGEVEGKEASIILARRLTSGDLRPLLRQMVVLIAPIYNADGNERISFENRPEQYGPIAGVGTRANAMGLDLNRDFMKLDSAEARSLTRLLNRWDPHLTVDLHTTNGSYHGYHLTYAPPLNPNVDPRLIALERETLLPAIQRAMLEKHSFNTYYYGNFASERDGERETERVDPVDPGDTIWRTFDHRPRYGNNYIGLRNRLAILSEAYSYLDFGGRVRATEAFVEEVLRVTAANADAITALTERVDRELVELAGTTIPTGDSASAERTRAERSLGVEFEITASPDPVEILVGDVTTLPNPRSGLEMRARTDEAVPVMMKEYGTFEATRSVVLPRGWVLPKGIVDAGRLAGALERLAYHGVEIQTVTAPARIDVERFVISAVHHSDRESQGHHETAIEGHFERALLSVQAGAIYVSARQPLARLAFYLLEPESDDGFVTWNIIKDGIAPGETYPIYRLMDPAGVHVK